MRLFINSGLTKTNSTWLIVFFSLLGLSVKAGTIGGWLHYRVADDEVEITDCSESHSGRISIPTKIEGLPVTSIGHSAFMHTSMMTDVVIPKSVTSIGNHAFHHCRSLKSVTIPDGVTKIGVNTFSQCRSLRSIKIPNTVRRIEGWAFVACMNLTSITIPNSVRSIGDYAFTDCTGLTSIRIPERFHNKNYAQRLHLSHLWPDGFRLPPDLPADLPPAQLSLSMVRTTARTVPRITVTGATSQTVVIETSDTVDGPWTEWRTVNIGGVGRSLQDSRLKAKKRFYRVRD